MKKQRRKTSCCLNCGRDLDQSFEYCPACGQENNDTQISFGGLIKDFFSNYFSLDSRFGRSIRPFFLRPGLLTREFMEGKRVKYANPIRLYLVVSLIHFFLMNLNITRHEEESIGFFRNTSAKASDSLSIDLDSVEVKLENTDKITLNENDSIGNEEESWPMSGAEWKIIKKLTDKKGPNHTVEQIEDSIRNHDKPYFAAKTNRQIIKIMKSDAQTINAMIVKNIPILMFFLLPMYALLLKAFFRKRLYINHLIHGLHVHSFVLIALTLYWIMALISPLLAEKIDVIFFIMICIYLILSFKNTYQIKYRTAVFKVMGTGFLYTVLLGFGLLLEALISLFLF